MGSGTSCLPRKNSAEPSNHAHAADILSATAATGRASNGTQMPILRLVDPLVPDRPQESGTPLARSTPMQPHIRVTGNATQAVGSAPLRPGPPNTRVVIRNGCSQAQRRVVEGGAGTTGASTSATPLALDQQPRPAHTISSSRASGSLFPYSRQEIPHTFQISSASSTIILDM